MSYHHVLFRWLGGFGLGVLALNSSPSLGQSPAFESLRKLCVSACPQPPPPPPPICCIDWKRIYSQALSSSRSSVGYIPEFDRYFDLSKATTEDRNNLNVLNEEYMTWNSFQRNAVIINAHSKTLDGTQQQIIKELDAKVENFLKNKDIVKK